MHTSTSAHNPSQYWEIVVQRLAASAQILTDFVKSFVKIEREKCATTWEKMYASEREIVKQQTASVIAYPISMLCRLRYKLLSFYWASLRDSRLFLWVK